MTALLELVEASRLLDRVAKVKLPSVLTEIGFLKEVLAEANDLRKAVNGDVERVLPQVRRSANIDWRGATPQQRDSVAREMARLMKGLPSQFLPGVRVVLDRRGKAVIKNTRGALTRRFRSLATVDPTLDRKDERAATTIAETTSVFFAPEYERQATNFRARAQKVVASGIDRGLDRRAIADELAKQFRETAIAGHYWETVAAVHVNRARSFSSVATYASAGVQRYEVVAVQDERTTEICKMMDGKTFVVRDALNRFDSLEDAKNLDEVKNEVMPFMRERSGGIFLPSGVEVGRLGRDGGPPSASLGEKEMAEAGISTPPYHFRCRSTTVPIL